VTKSVPERVQKLDMVKYADSAHGKSKKLSSIQVADYTTEEESYPSSGKPPKTPHPLAAVQAFV